ncbi:MAG TPA: hypothetical protein PKD91_01990 [Bacteroidia bacterium]|nr:hypothetical protein [Bacteroidia bacterium]
MQVSKKKRINYHLIKEKKYLKKQRRLKRHLKIKHYSYNPNDQYDPYSTVIPNIYPKRKLKNSFKFKLQRPKYSENILHLSSDENIFSNNKYPPISYLLVPKCFSFIENSEESFDFLKKLFYSIKSEKCKDITIDYKECTRIDVDASILMDVILMEFKDYLNQCHKNGIHINPRSLTPKNFKGEIEKILFSIGAFRNVAGFDFSYNDVISLPVLINDNRSANVWSKSELHQTKIVEHIKTCLKRMNRTLSINSETEFYKIIGEIMNNAEEHGTMPFRYAIGMFHDINKPGNHFGVFNLTIFNFGKSIYEKFNSPDCKNQSVVQQMKELSGEFTRKGWIKKAEFEEETLWTLYALQEGVTSTPSKRGNGSIQFIENFFKLKGSENPDDISKMVIISGNTRIEFDGTYEIKEKITSSGKKPYKLVTFNESADFNEPPDKKFVKFAPNYFPGTLLSVRILMNYQNTTNETT